MEDFNTLLKERGRIVADYILNNPHVVNYKPDSSAKQRLSQWVGILVNRRI